MKPPWLEAWLGAPLASLDAERLGLALEAARQIADRLSREQDKPQTPKGVRDHATVLREWQEAIACLMSAKAALSPPEPLPPPQDA